MSRTRLICFLLGSLPPWKEFLSHCNFSLSVWTTILVLCCNCAISNFKYNSSKSLFYSPCLCRFLYRRSLFFLLFNALFSNCPSTPSLGLTFPLLNIYYNFHTDKIFPFSVMLCSFTIIALQRLLHGITWSMVHISVLIPMQQDLKTCVTYTAQFTSFT